MKFEVSTEEIEKISNDGTVIFYFQDKKAYAPLRTFKSLSIPHQKAIGNALKLSRFKAKLGQIITVPLEEGSLTSQIIAVGLGKKDEFSPSELRKVAAGIAKTVKGKVNSLAVPVEGLDVPSVILAQNLTEGILLGSYSFGKYKKREEGEDDLEVLYLQTVDKSLSASLKEGIELGELYSNATILARNLVNEPAEVVTPTHLAKFASDIAKGNEEISVKIFDRDEAEKLGMNAFLGIARAADTPPKFIYLHYKPKNKSKRKLAIVGKGVTFDSGGINVKPGDSMQTMKEDMSGAAAVLAVFSVLAGISPSFEVMGLIAATPNLISGKSIVPGDIVRAMNGKTIEVLNTDAEGRVTMADSLSFAVKNGATEIIDLATLTGASQVALGTGMAALFSNNKTLLDGIKNSSEVTGEKLWELPLEKEYKDLNKSEVADIANIPSTRYGGTITAALFLAEFVENTPWAHLDIAPTAFAEGKYDLGPKGGTGFGVRLLLNYIQNHK